MWLRSKPPSAPIDAVSPSSHARNVAIGTWELGRIPSNGLAGAPETDRLVKLPLFAKHGGKKCYIREPKTGLRAVAIIPFKRSSSLAQSMASAFVSLSGVIVRDAEGIASNNAVIGFFMFFPHPQYRTLTLLWRQWIAKGGVILITFALSGCGGVLTPQGPVGDADRTILLDSLAIMLVIVVPTITATLLFAWWFRASNIKARRRPDFVYSGQIELLVWSVPVLVIMLLAGVTWIGAHELDPTKPLASPAKPLEVQVVSLDWKWLFIYPAQNIASVNVLTIPAGLPVHFSLTSASVMNTFFVPRLGSMIYTMNGMVTQLNLRADRTGDFHGQSSHFSGDGFSGMYFEAHAVTPNEFARWAAVAKQTGVLLDSRAYKALAQQSMDVRPQTYRAVTPGLFADIVNLKIAPGPGPASLASAGAGH